MTLIEFLSYGLEKGQRMTLSFIPFCSDRLEVVDCCFAGYRFYHGATHASQNDNIIPIFHKVNDKGEMSRFKIDDNPWLENIINVQPIGAPGDKTGLEESESIEKAVLLLRNRAKDQVSSLLSEMNDLFPGKKVYFDIDYGAIGSVFDRHDYGFIGDIIAAGWKDGAPVFDVSGGGIVSEDVPLDFVKADWTEVRSALLHSIMCPVSEKDACHACPENFVDPDKTDWKDIPKTDSKTHPILHSCEAVDWLRTELWYKNLSGDRKKKALDHWVKMYEEDATESRNETFDEYADKKWAKLEARWRKDILAGAEKRLSAEESL